MQPSTDIAHSTPSPGHPAGGAVAGREGDDRSIWAGAWRTLPWRRLGWKGSLCREQCLALLHSMRGRSRGDGLRLYWKNTDQTQERALLEKRWTSESGLHMEAGCFKKMPILGGMSLGREADQSFMKSFPAEASSITSNPQPLTGGCRWRGRSGGRTSVPHWLWQMEILPLDLKSGVKWANISKGPERGILSLPVSP